MTKTLTVAQLAELLGGEVLIDSAVLITGISEPENALASHCTFLLEQRPLARTEAAVLITPAGIMLDFIPQAHITVANSRLAFAKTLAYFYPEPITAPKVGIHPQASVDPTAQIDPSASVAAHVYVGAGAIVGAGSKLFAGVYLGSGVTVGADCLLYPNAVVLDHCVLGNRVILNPGAVIGGDGFGFVTTRQGHLKIPQTGKVILEDDVEIGANTTIDRATLRETKIGRGTKIDNLVMIGHNAQVGDDCMIISQSGIAGSTKLGDRCIVAAQAGIASLGHVEIGSDSVVYGRAGVHKSFAAGSQIAGFPAQEHKKERRQQVSLTRVPELISEMRQLKRRLEELETALQNPPVD